MRISLLAAGAALAFVAMALPAAAQEDPVAIGVNPSAQLEPLSEEQKARLPLARALVDVIVPETGTLDVLGYPYSAIFGRSDLDTPRDPRHTLRARLGHPDEDLEISDENARAAMLILDPDWVEREAADREAMRQLRQFYADNLSPLLRQGLVEAFAVEFDEQVLRDAGAFYATDSGRAFGTGSLSIGSHPRVMAALIRRFEDGAMMEAMQAQAAEMQSAVERLAPPRDFEDLTEAQLSELSALVGLTEAEIEAAMTYDWENDFRDEADVLSEEDGPAEDN